MGTWTWLEPTCLSYKLNELGRIAPPLWYALFSPADALVDKDNNGLYFACVSTRPGRARNRISRLRRRIKGDAYAETLFAPLDLLDRLLSDLAPDASVGFDLTEWQEEAGLPDEAVEFIEFLTGGIAPFEEFITGGSLARLIKHLAGPIFLGDLEKDRKSLRRQLDPDSGMGLADYAFSYLIGEPSYYKTREEKLYQSWVEAHRSLWEGEAADRRPAEAPGAAGPEASEPETEEPGAESSAVQNGLVKEYGHENKLISALRYKNGKLNGLCRYYSYAGEKRFVETELRYRDGKRQGLCRYRGEGYLKSWSYFRNDRLHGIDRCVCGETGELLAANLFRNGRLVKKLAGGS